MPGLITTNKINHVTTMVKDTAVAMEFYNNLLGIKQIESQVDNPEITWLQLDSGIMVHLIETQEAPAKPDRIHHAFEVEDFEGTRSTLEQNGFEIEREGVRYDGQAFLFIHDPDGNRVEFCTASGYAPPPRARRAARDRQNCDSPDSFDCHDFGLKNRGNYQNQINHSSESLRSQPCSTKFSTSDT